MEAQHSPHNNFLGRTGEDPWDVDDAVQQVRRWHAIDRPLLALTHLNHWIEEHPNRPELWYYRAFFCARIGLRLEEVRSWREYLRLRPENRLMARLVTERLDILAER